MQYFLVATEVDFVRRSISASSVKLPFHLARPSAGCCAGLVSEEIKSVYSTLIFYYTGIKMQK